VLRKRIFFIVVSLFLLNSCTCILNSSRCVPVDLNCKIAVIPFNNNTETPLAGERAMAITAAVLESRGACCVAVYQHRQQGKVLFPGMTVVASRKTLLNWARNIHAHYALTGSVNEWTYKVGLDGEPVVGISLQLIDVKTGRILWTAVGSLSRGCRTAVSTAAQVLINNLLNGLFCTNCPKGKFSYAKERAHS
jgi:polysaccharide biosynthesis protein PelC